MTNPKENHKRYRTTRKLEGLVGRFILVTELEANNIVNHNAGILKFEGQSQGYNVNGIKIPVRSIRYIGIPNLSSDYKPELLTNNDYLKLKQKVSI